MADNTTRNIIATALAEGRGILRLEPAWVARDFLPPGKRLGLKDEEYEVGERGWISERWIGSTTKADNRISPPDEGLSYVGIPGERITLKEAVEVAGDLIMGAEYAKTHKGLGRLAKIYDFGARIPYHIHQMEKDAKLVGANSKEEAYYFPEDVDLGPHPETFFGVHPYIVQRGQAGPPPAVPGGVEGRPDPAALAGLPERARARASTCRPACCTRPAPR